MASSTIGIPLSALLETVTKTAALGNVLSLFKSLKFQVTSWRSGGIGMTVAHFLADLVSTKSELVYLIAASGFLDLAEGAWLTLLAKNVFDEDRQAAVYTVGKIRLTSSDGAPPYNLTANQVWAETSAGLRFNTTEGGVLASGAGEYIDLEVIAEHPGGDYNVANGAIDQLVTSLPGVTVSNPEIGSTGTWITTEGVDEESDDSLKQRCKDKWAILAFADPAAKYRYYARSADSTVTRAFVDDDNPRGPGTVDVYIAGDSGAITDDTVKDAVDAVLQAQRGICIQVETKYPTNKPVALTGTVYYRDAVEDDVKSAVEAKLQAYFKVLDIGGEVIGSDPGRVYRDALLGEIHAGDGVVRVNLTAPAADVDLAETEVATHTVAGLTYQAA